MKDDIPVIEKPCLCCLHKLQLQLNKFARYAWEEIPESNKFSFIYPEYKFS